MKNFDFLFVSKSKRPAMTRLATLAALLLTTSLHAQQRLTVSGVVTDAASGEPIIGASVIVASTYKGTTTGVNGDFMLTNVPAKDSLIFQHLNYTRLVVPVNGRTKIDAKLSVSSVEIEEVVAVGYGYVPRSNLTSSIAVISEKDIKISRVVDRTGAPGQCDGRAGHHRVGRAGQRSGHAHPRRHVHLGRHQPAGGDRQHPLGPDRPVAAQPQRRGRHRDSERRRRNGHLRFARRQRRGDGHHPQRPGRQAHSFRSMPSTGFRSRATASR